MRHIIGIVANTWSLPTQLRCRRHGMPGISTWSGYNRWWARRCSPRRWRTVQERRWRRRSGIRCTWIPATWPIAKRRRPGHLQAALTDFFLARRVYYIVGSIFDILFYLNRIRRWGYDGTSINHITLRIQRTETIYHLISRQIGAELKINKELAYLS